MRLRLSNFFLFCISISAFGQMPEPLFFKEKIHDFGEVIEQNGNVEFEFVFTNNSARPVRILAVQASCGCTTPGWTKEAVAPGKNGFIKASFDPRGRPGYFNKALTVTTDLSTNPINLQIKGNVVDKLSPKEELLTGVNGSLRMKSSSVNIGKIYINKEPSSYDFIIRNEGEEKMDFIGVVAPDYIKVTTPASLEKGERGIIQIRYNAKQKNQYGFHSDNIELKTTDRVMPNKFLSVYATIEEYFPVLSTEELLRAQVMQVEKAEIDIGRVRSGATIEQTVRYTNSGKKSLDVRDIQSNCSCVSATFDKKVLKPGESGTITLRFITEGRSGTQNKAVTIYTNDPRNPVQRVTISGYIE
jgi:archaellum component FlaF (FlaF/FlaG flagellin family)